MSEAIVALIRVLIVDGIPALVDVVTKWKIVNPTLDDFQILKDVMKRPEDF